MRIWKSDFDSYGIVGPGPVTRAWVDDLASVTPDGNDISKQHLIRPWSRLFERCKEAAFRLSTMRYAMIFDIHGNLPALQAVPSHIDATRVEAVSTWRDPG